MKVIHKNSREEFELTKPIYHKSYLYGYLVGMDNKVFFITFYEDVLDYVEVTENFEILE